ncbi:MAG: DUF1622 domain-containing protein [Thermomicrobiales bacterium]
MRVVEASGIDLFRAAASSDGGFIGAALKVVDYASIVIELLAVVIIVVAVVYGTVVFLSARNAKAPRKEAYDQYRHTVGDGLLLGLEILVAGDVIRTVILDPTLESVAVLGALVVIRTFLTWSLVVEMEGHWPWRSKPEQGH